MLDRIRLTSIDDRYRILQSLGRGGMGEVYLARDGVLDREVAVKVLAERYSRDKEAVERFKREAKSAASLSHPGIVSIHDLGETQGGTHYIVMEYVPGGTLRERISRGRLMDAWTAAEISSQVAAALGTAHEGGVIHRDVKPENILFTRSGRVKVTDFGIARAVSRSCLTETGFALGTADYVSPEQAMGEPVGPESDLYSLGVVLYQMVSGERPFEADSPLATAIKHANEPPPKLGRLGEENTDFPGKIGAVVGKLLAKNPGDRYGSAPELVADLERVKDELDPVGETVKMRGVPFVAPHRAQGPTSGPLRPNADVTLRTAAHKIGAKRRRRMYIAGAVLSTVVILLLLGMAGALGPIGARDGDLPPEASPRDGSAQKAGHPGTKESNSKPAPTERIDEKQDGPDASTGSEASDQPVSVFVHRATPANVSFNSTYIDDPRTNGHPDAVLSVTQNWNPGGSGGTYNDHPVGVWYDAGAGRWAIFNQDRAAMPDGAAFNVSVSGGARADG